MVKVHVTLRTTTMSRLISKLYLLRHQYRMLMQLSQCQVSQTRCPRSNGRIRYFMALKHLFKLKSAEVFVEDTSDAAHVNAQPAYAAWQSHVPIGMCTAAQSSQFNFMIKHMANKDIWRCLSILQNFLLQTSCCIIICTSTRCWCRFETLFGVHISSKCDRCGAFFLRSMVLMSLHMSVYSIGRNQGSTIQRIGIFAARKKDCIEDKKDLLKYHLVYSMKMGISSVFLITKFFSSLQQQLRF